MKSSREPFLGLLRQIAWATFVLGAAIAGAGVVFVYLRITGAIEFEIFGQTFKSLNVGIAAVFLGVVLVVVNIRRVLKTFEKFLSRETGEVSAAPGEVESESDADAKRELKEFYSSVASLLYRLIRKGERERVKEDLTTPTLHYTFSRVWTRIPEKDKELSVRDLIFAFLKGGDRLEGIETNDKFRQLCDWLEGQSK